MSHLMLHFGVSVSCALQPNCHENVTQAGGYVHQAYDLNCKKTCRRRLFHDPAAEMPVQTYSCNCRRGVTHCHCDDASIQPSSGWGIADQGAQNVASTPAATATKSGGGKSMSSDPNKVWPTGLTLSEAEEVHSYLIDGTRVFGVIALLAHLLVAVTTPWLG
jgi:light-harvesting protein B-800-850 beta chain